MSDTAKVFMRGDSQVVCFLASNQVEGNARIGKEGDALIPEPPLVDVWAWLDSLTPPETAMRWRVVGCPLSCQDYRYPRRESPSPA
jgi:hypothetical protein